MAETPNPFLMMRSRKQRTYSRRLGGSASFLLLCFGHSESFITALQELLSARPMPTL
jgi:hypothetical protein